MADTKSTASKIRLDQALVDRGHFASRSRARDAIIRAAVTVGGIVVTKPGHLIGGGVKIDVDDPAHSYVSRAALKLIAGLDHFGLDPAGKVALDLGASTGGFTQVLLERHAVRVVAVDVGQGQLHKSIAEDSRVLSLEGLNARDLTREHLQGCNPEFIVSDVSFISLKLALPPALLLAAPGALGVFLVKPQFEAGRGAIGKGGLLRDPAVGDKIAGNLSQWLDSMLGWRSLGVWQSPLTGSDGNREFLLGGVRDR